MVGIVASLCDGMEVRWRAPRRTPRPARPRLHPGPRLRAHGGRGPRRLLRARGPEWAPIVAVLVFMGSAQMVSYVRARAEALGVDCKVGSCPGRNAWWSASGSCSRGGSRAARASSCGGCTSSPLLTVITVVHREVHVLRKLRARCGRRRSKRPRRPRTPARTAGDSATICGPSPRGAAVEVLTPPRRGRDDRRRVIYSRALSRAGRAPFVRPDPAPIDAAARGGRSQWR